MKPMIHYVRVDFTEALKLQCRQERCSISQCAAAVNLMTSSRYPSVTFPFSRGPEAWNKVQSNVSGSLGAYQADINGVYYSNWIQRQRIQLQDEI